MWCYWHSHDSSLAHTNTFHLLYTEVHCEDETHVNWYGDEGDCRQSTWTGDDGDGVMVSWWRWWRRRIEERKKVKRESDMVMEWRYGADGLGREWKVRLDEWFKYPGLARSILKLKKKHKIGYQVAGLTKNYIRIHPNTRFINRVLGSKYLFLTNWVNYSFF